MKIDKIIKNLRKENKITQTKLAEYCGVKQSTISKWEKSEAVPNAENIVSLAKFFNVSSDYLLGLENYS